MNSAVENKRDNAIDIMKGFITLLMVLSHSMSFTTVPQSNFSFYVNLTTFSAFLFCFGYVCNLAYLQKPILPWKKMVRGGLKTLGAYYLSAFLYLFLIEHDFRMAAIGNLLTQRWIAGYSEFLLSWAYLYFLMILFAPVLRAAARNPYLCVVLTLLSLSLTFLDYESIPLPWLGPVVGYRTEYYFPLLQYFSFFLAGSYLSQRKKGFSPPIFLAALLGSLACIVYFLRTSLQPRRWGPSFLWIVGGYFFVYLYYLLAKRAVLPQKISSALEQIGRHTLLYLLVSNTLCFVSINVLHFLPRESILVRLLVLSAILLASFLLPPLVQKALKAANFTHFVRGER